jgi:hypothetical protein
VALDRQLELVGAHAAAVVADPDEAAPAVGEHDVDAPCPGIERVLGQLLDHACRALDHLAGGDAVDRPFWQAPDAHHMVSSTRG